MCDVCVQCVVRVCVILVWRVYVVCVLACVYVCVCVVWCAVCELRL